MLTKSSGLPKIFKIGFLLKLFQARFEKWIITTTLEYDVIIHRLVTLLLPYDRIEATCNSVFSNIPQYTYYCPALRDFANTVSQYQNVIASKANANECQLVLMLNHEYNDCRTKLQILLVKFIWSLPIQNPHHDILLFLVMSIVYCFVQIFILQSLICKISVLRGQYDRNITYF